MLKRPMAALDSQASAQAALELAFAQAVCARIGEELGLVVDRPLALEDVRVERMLAKPRAEGGVQLSFRLVFERAQQRQQGCLLVPLAEAISLASYLALAPEDVVRARRALAVLDRPLKESLLELCAFVATAVDAVVRARSAGACSVQPDGCQGVAAGAKPVFAYREGEALLVLRARAQLHGFPPFELLAALPEFAVQGAANGAGE
jgi:hypothetical protein